MNREVYKRAPISTSNGGLTSGTNGHISTPNGNDSATKVKRRKVKRLRQRPHRRTQSGIISSIIFALLVAILGATLIFLIRFVMTDTISYMDDDKKASMAQKLSQNLGPDSMLRNAAGGLGRKHKKKKRKQMDDDDRRNVKSMPPIPDDDSPQTPYRHSDYLEDIGDKSRYYSNLRKEYDTLLPSTSAADEQRIQSFVKSIHENMYKPQTIQESPYDVHNCPDEPPPNYPYAWNIQQVLDNWPPDDTTPRPTIYQGLCTFDFQTEMEKALNYRKAEVPFVVRNDPKVMRTVERWNQPKYLDRMLKNKKYRTEYSPNNHFMYWMAKKKKNTPDGWKPPTEMIRMTYKDWLSHANITDESKLGPDMEHWYFRLIGCGEMGNCDQNAAEYLFDELSFFQPTDKNELYMVKPKEQKGIHCRFGMKGVIAENHFDGSRNMIAILGGERRYILSHPDQCENLALYPKGHPSARHSEVDWSNPDWEKFPKFKDAEVNEVVMQAGDILYLPTNWFHYIISLGLNFQCNTRSGVTRDYAHVMHACGF